MHAIRHRLCRTISTGRTEHDSTVMQHKNLNDHLAPLRCCRTHLVGNPLSKMRKFLPYRGKISPWGGITPLLRTTALTNNDLIMVAALSRIFNLSQMLVVDESFNRFRDAFDTT